MKLKTFSWQLITGVFAAMLVIALHWELPSILVSRAFERESHSPLTRISVKGEVTVICSAVLPLKVGWGILASLDSVKLAVGSEQPTTPKSKKDKRRGLMCLHAIL